MTTTGTGLHPYLKLATAAAHSNLERVLATRGYFDSRGGYIDYLRRFHAFHDEAERWLDASGAARVIPDWSERRRADVAGVDLVALGATDSVPVVPSNLLPQLRGPAQVFGVAYVLEGSTLGGAFLLKQLAPLGVTASQGGAYLASYGIERGRMWQRFLKTLEAADVHPEPVAAAALAAFGAARYFLTEASMTVGPLVQGSTGAAAALAESQRTRATRACSMVA